MLLGELIRDTEKRFRAAKLSYGHGTSNARDEAAFLVLRALRLPFDADLSREATPKAAKQIEPLVRSRIEKRIPVAYLLKEAWLDGRRFYVDRRVIVPRSHIAFLLKSLGRPKRVLDLCTGSGCLAILAAYAFPHARIEASDLSDEALEVAARNTREHGLQKRIRLIRSDLFESVRGEYDLILTNPPYVGAGAMRKLPPEYRYEPGLALAGGRDGLDLVDRILRGAASHLASRGRLVCEIGDGRRTFRKKHPRLRVAWPLPEVFVAGRKDLEP
jgi:ribosomal protein L3 glutamine methyltransferase